MPYRMPRAAGEVKPRRSRLLWVGLPVFMVFAVFGGVVQQGRDRLIFVGAVFHGDRRHAEHVRDVGNAGALAALAVMHLPGIGHRGGKPIGRRQRHSPMVA